jgi:outer membrane protein OmpA-like peptidoglycan-associated protein
MPSCSLAVRSLAVAATALGAGVAAAQPAPATTPTATLAFAPRSVEISDAGRRALDALAQSLTERAVRQVELRAYAVGEDADEARKLGLARALAVRSYLIEHGVKARIEVTAFAVAGRGAGERIDVLVP